MPGTSQFLSQEDARSVSGPQIFSFEAWNGIETVMDR